MTDITANTYSVNTLVRKQGPACRLGWVPAIEFSTPRGMSRSWESFTMTFEVPVGIFNPAERP